jgi:NTP pyrophosphatase (non-canonical NTP hydrolase)
MSDLLKNYERFVEAVTSKESNNLADFMNRLSQLEATTDVNLPLLLTSGLGLGSEGGEFQEIVKKVFFQGKELTPENIFHMKRELGDVLWYWISACRALNLNPNEVLAENVKKLESRYPGGQFDVFQSENRRENDL